MSQPAFESVVFDLDGTLVDSLAGIETSLRAALAATQPHLQLACGALRSLIGPPLSQIATALWPELNRNEISVLVAAYRAHYLMHGCATTVSFPETAELLNELHAVGTRLFILTNKPLAQTDLILTRQKWRGLFEEASCPDDLSHPFPDKPQGAINLQKRRRLPARSTLMVGDAPDDARAARAAGFTFMAAGYGYGYPGGHGSSLDENCPVAGDVAGLRSLIFNRSLSPPPHDHPQSLR